MFLLLSDAQEIGFPGSGQRASERTRWFVAPLKPMGSPETNTTRSPARSPARFARFGLLHNTLPSLVA
jgi:hypothetical protein